MAAIESAAGSRGIEIDWDWLEEDQPYDSEGSEGSEDWYGSESEGDNGDQRSGR